MKITDLTLVFIAVLLPIIIVVYINVSFNIKAGEQELYYKKIVDTAALDAANQMKQVENEDKNIDYGYSGLEDSKVSVNAQVAVDTFFNNLYNNFGIKGNDAAERYLQLYVPAIAIIDYDGVQISSVETYDKNGESITEHVLKPKRYYTYDYTIVKNTTTPTTPTTSKYEIKAGIVEDGNGYNAVSYHHIEFTMDDYITHRGSRENGTDKEIPVKSFYITDRTLIDTGNGIDKEYRNYDLIDGVVGSEKDKFLTQVEEHLQYIRKDILVNTVVKEMTYAVNKNNTYAKNAGITYTFAFPTTTQDEMYSSIENVGFMAFVQGISVGNKYLNTKAYGINSLELSTRYYFTIPSTESDYKINLYHKFIECSEYKKAMNWPNLKDSTISKISPRYSTTKQQASIATVLFTKIDAATGTKTNEEHTGFYPCPVCNP